MIGWLRTAGEKERGSNIATEGLAARSSELGPGGDLRSSASVRTLFFGPPGPEAQLTPPLCITSSDATQSATLVHRMGRMYLVRFVQPSSCAVTTAVPAVLLHAADSLP